MSRVLKHELPRNPTALKLPVGSQFLTFASVIEPQAAQPRHYVWTEEPTDQRAETKVWVIWTLMTGDHVTPEAKQHLGSHVGYDGMGSPYVTHYWGTTAP